MRRGRRTSFQARYEGPNRDGDVGPLPENITTSYTRRGHTKKVTHDVGAYVRRLSEMEVRIEEILGTRHWAAYPK